MNYTDVDFLILGQGLAGTAFGIMARQQGFSFKILSDNQFVSSSSKAVGLVNPVTGRRMVKTWNCDEIFPQAFQFYKSAYQQIFPTFHAEQSFLEPMPIYKALHSTEEINFISGRSAWDEYQSVISVLPASENEAIFDSVAGWCKIELGGRLDPEFYLQSAAVYFENQGSLKVGKFNRNILNRKDDFWTYDEINARNIVSCLGLNCPWVGGELFPVKGQVFVLSGLPDFGRKVLKTDKFFVPYKPGLVLAGSTYEREFENVETDEKGMNEILAALHPKVRSGIRIEDSWAGLRPTTLERRPIIRKIEEGLFVLNGLGTKGVTLSPWAAQKVLELASVSRNSEFLEV